MKASHHLAVWLAVALGAVMGCAPESDRPLVRIGYTRYLTMSPMFIAEAEGYFDEQGIDVQLVQMRSAAMSIPTLAQRELDVVSGPMSPALFNAIHRGAPVKLVLDKGAYLEGCGATAFAVASHIAGRDPRILPKRIGIGREPYTTFRLERIIDHFGFDMDDVEPILLLSAARYQALSSGGLDAAILSEPFLGRFRKEGGEIWMIMREVFPDHQYSTFAFGPRLLNDDRDLGRKVAVALLKGVRAQNQGSTPRNVEILEEALGWDRAMLEEACWAKMRHDGRINTESITEFQEWALARGDLDAIVSPATYLDSTFAHHARETLDGSP